MFNNSCTIAKSGVKELSFNFRQFNFIYIFIEQTHRTAIKSLSFTPNAPLRIFLVPFTNFVYCSFRTLNKG